MFRNHVKVVFGHDLTFIMTILMEEYKKKLYICGKFANTQRKLKFFIINN